MTNTLKTNKYELKQGSIHNLVRPSTVSAGQYIPAPDIKENSYRMHEPKNNLTFHRFVVDT